MFLQKEKSKNYQLAVNIISSVISTVAGLGVAFLLTPYLISNIGKEVYSFYPIANNFVTYFTIIVTALNAMASRFITIEILQGHEKKSKIYFSSVFFSNVILVIIFLVPMVIVTYNLERIFDIPDGYVWDVKILFSLVFAAMIINVLSSIFGVATFVKERIDLRSYQQLIVVIFRLLLYVGLFTIFKPNIIYVGIVALCESIINLIIQIFQTIKLIPGFNISYKLAQLSAVKELIISGIWNSINSLGSNLLSGISIFLANLTIGAAASGNLSIVQTLVNLCTTLITMLVNVFYPRLTREYASNGLKGLERATLLSQKIMGGITTVPILLLIIYGKEFYQLWMPSENSDLLQFLSFICLVPYVIEANMWTLTQLYSVLNHVKTPSIIMLLFGISNMISILVATQFWKDVFIIPLITTLFILGYCLIFVPLHIAHELKISAWCFYLHFIRMSIASAVIIVMGYGIKKFTVLDNWGGLFISGCITGILGYIIYFFVAIINREICTFLKVRLKG